MTASLRRVGNYEEALAQATKGEQHVNGVINFYLANAATRIINNPELQRVKDRLEDDLTQQTRNHSPNSACARGFLLILYRITFVVPGLPIASLGT